MRKTILLTLAFVLLDGAAAEAQTARRGAGARARSRQMLVVTTPDWDSVGGTLRRFERRVPEGRWAPVGADVPVVVGRAGLGWGVGVFGVLKAEGPTKKEGDGKAPAGVFRLGTAFGFAPARGAAWLRLPYLPLTPQVECVDDVASSRYNLIVNRDAVRRVDWNSSERMRSVEGYRWGLVVEHNAAPAVAGRGSCIFLHVWAGPETGTAGCTAMEGANMEALLRWLDPRKRPVLVQLPEGEYARLRRAWRLPPAAGGK